LAILLDRAEDSLILAEDTLRIGRSAMAEQRIYYRALSKMVVLDANRLGKAIGSAEQAIRNEDTRLAESHRQLDQFVTELQRTASTGTETIRQAGTTAAALEGEIDTIGGDSQRVLAQGAAVLATVDETLKDPSIAQTSANLAQSAANLERMSAAGAESAERVRDILNPKKRSFWIRLLELMIPRPTVRVGP
jgi:DNA-binding ferritin-like protein